MFRGVLAGSWDLVRKVRSAFIGVAFNIVALLITLLYTKSHDPSRALSSGFRVCGFRVSGLEFRAWGV